MMQFKKAVKFEAKGRVALIGPAGSGKSYTMLVMARLLAGPEGKIAAIDTEHGSLSKYADLFDFDVIELDSFSPDNFLSALTAAEQAKYDVFCGDSLSHFWMGKDGALEFVDDALKKAKARANGRADDMAGWKDFRPHERLMVDRMIASSCHIVTTMRTKTAYEMQTGGDGKKRRIKVGLAPVQREGLEYEFDLVAMMDDENTLIVDKTRCPALSGKAITKPSAKELEVFKDWLNGSIRPAVIAPEPEWKYEENRLSCKVSDVQTRDKNGKQFVAIKHNGQVNGKNAAFCFDTKLFNALKDSNGHSAHFLISASGDYVNITDVLKIDGVDYREGQIDDGEIVPAPAVHPNAVTPSNPITDDDLPF